MTLHVYEELEQGTPEWHDARRGVLTASVIGKLLTLESPSPLTVGCPKCKAVEQEPCMSLAATKAPTPIKTLHAERVAVVADLPREVVVADNDTSRALTATLAAERIAGWTDEGSFTRDMERGVLAEPFARKEYAKHVGDPVSEVGFMVRTEDEWTLGYSPDALVGHDGLLEVKAPRTKGHVLTVVDGSVPDYYMPQLQAGLLVSGRAWIDFLPYVSGLPLWVTRVYPDPAWQGALIAAATKFEKDAAHIVAAYKDATTNLPATERIDYYFLEVI